MSVWVYKNDNSHKYMLQIIIKTANHIKQIDYECDNIHAPHMISELIKLANGDRSIYYPKPFEYVILTNLYRAVDNHMARAYILVNPADYAEILRPIALNYDTTNITRVQLPVDADFLRAINAGLPKKTKYTNNHPTLLLPKHPKRKFRKAYSTTRLI